LTPQSPYTDDARNRQQTSTPPTDSAGWRTEYAAQRVEATFFDSNHARRGEREAADEDLTMHTETCPFCDWSGAANSYPDHLTDCDGVDDGQLVADGGVDLPERGDERVDRDTDGDGRVLVLDVHADARADTWVVEALDDTVAAVNPEYPADEPVVAAVYVDALEDVGIADRPVDDVEHAANLGEVGVYHFPASRLASREWVEA